MICRGFLCILYGVWGSHKVHPHSPSLKLREQSSRPRFPQRTPPRIKAGRHRGKQGHTHTCALTLEAWHGAEARRTAGTSIHPRRSPIQKAAAGLRCRCTRTHQVGLASGERPVKSKSSFTHPSLCVALLPLFSTAVASLFLAPRS